MTGVADARGTCRHSLAGRVVNELVVNQVLAARRPRPRVESSRGGGRDTRAVGARRELATPAGASPHSGDTPRRQYQAAEPENRLVTRTLERRWEEALQEVRQLDEEYARFRLTQPIALQSQGDG